MAEIEIKRVNFFDGQFLKQGEFLDLDSYHLHMRRRWGFVMFNQSGVIQATGSDLTIDVPNPAQKSLRIRSGMAIGKRPDLAEAKEVVLREDTSLISLTAASPNVPVPLGAGDTGFVTIHYDEEAVAIPPSEGDVPGNTRIREHARVTIHNAVPAPNAPNGEPYIRLGDVAFNTMAVSSGARQTAFLQSALMAATPQIVLSPNSAAANGNVSIAVTSSGGLNLSAATPANVTITPNQGVSNITVTNQLAGSMTLGFTLTNANAGNRTVTVTIGALSAQATFIVQAGLQLASFAGIDEPNNDLLFKINGSGFISPVTVAFSIGVNTFSADIPANVTPTQVTVDNNLIPPNAIVGPVKVKSGGDEVDSAFNVTPPPIIGNIPAQVQTQTNLTIPGGRFIPGQTTITLPGNAVRGPLSVPAFPAVNFGESIAATQIVVRVTSNAGQNARVRVTTPGGTKQSATILTVN